MFTNFTLEIAPEHSDEFVSLFDLLFHFQPVFEALIVDEAYTATALARDDAGVNFIALRTPAEPTLALRDCSFAISLLTFTFLSAKGDDSSSFL